MEQNEEKSEFRVSGSLFMFMVTEGGFPKSEVDTFCKIWKKAAAIEYFHKYKI